MRTDRFLTVIAVVLAVFILMASSSHSQVYRYQDENGVWHFTDSPPDQEGLEAEQISSGISPKAAQGTRDLQKQLVEKVPPKNKIEEARNATVSVETALGSGSGFFISENGYVITCKHVITGIGIDLEQTEQNLETAGRNLEKTEGALDQEESWLEIEQIWLTKAEKELAEIDRRVQAGEIRLNSADLAYYNTYVSEYNTRLTEFRRRQSEYNLDKAEVDQMRAKYTEQSENLNEINVKQAFQRGYPITLADKTVLNAEQIALSDSHDLALLKLEGYKTPYVRQGDTSVLGQGETLYAIGNPLKLDHSVTSGVFSGRREGMLQTNAQINPGNSGGPLINAQGQVIGINTMKLGGENIEGIGFAIPIEVAIEEFSDYLP
jgi:hypothetical protein